MRQFKRVIHLFREFEILSLGVWMSDFKPDSTFGPGRSNSTFGSA